MYASSRALEYRGPRSYYPPSAPYRSGLANQNPAPNPAAIVPIAVAVVGGLVLGGVAWWAYTKSKERKEQPAATAA